MDEQTKKRYDRAIFFLEQEFGLYIISFPNKKERDEATENIRLGLAMKADLIHETLNELPF